MIVSITITPDIEKGELTLFLHPRNSLEMKKTMAIVIVVIVVIPVKIIYCSATFHPSLLSLALPLIGPSSSPDMVLIRLVTQIPTHVDICVSQT